SIPRVQALREDSGSSRAIIRYVGSS
ncbi:hypothetical protein PGANDO_0981, partial [Porphyromonas gingivalis]